jgi:murein DD-endopeptidase MepM/ murein hydrolase activator NlpD
MQKRFYLMIIFVLIQCLVLTGCPSQSNFPGTDGESKTNANSIVLSTLQSPFQGSNKDNWRIVQSFGSYYSAKGGCHTGEDWHTDNDGPEFNGVKNAEVYSIAAGKVVKIGSAGKNNGYYIIVEHTGKFKIPESTGVHLYLSTNPLGTGKLGSNNGAAIAYSKDVFNNLEKSDYMFTDEPSYNVKTKIVDKIYSVYMHVQDPSIVEKNDMSFMEIKEGTIINDISKPIAKLQQIKEKDSKGILQNVSHLHFEIRDGEIIDDFLKNPKNASLNAVINNLSANGYFKYKTDGNTQKNTIQNVVDNGYCEPSYVVQQNYGQTAATESSTKTNAITNGSYQIQVTKALADNGAYYLMFKTITRYDLIWDYINKTQGNSYEVNMKKYYDRNYPVTEYKDGEINQIPIQNLLKITGMSKSKLLSILAEYPGPNDDIVFYTLVNKTKLKCKISGSCDIKLSGYLSTQMSITEKTNPKELINRINKFFKKYSYFEYISRVSIEVSNGEIKSFSEAYHP